MTRPARRRPSWPVEVRELHDAVVRAAAAGDLRAVDLALDHLLVLAEHVEEPAIMKAARLACVRLALLYDPDGLAAAIESSAGLGSLRPLIDSGAASSRRRRRIHRRTR